MAAGGCTPRRIGSGLGEIRGPIFERWSDENRDLGRSICARHPPGQTGHRSATERSPALPKMALCGGYVDCVIGLGLRITKSRCRTRRAIGRSSASRTQRSGTKTKNSTAPARSLGPPYVLFNPPSIRSLPALAILTFVMLARSLALPSRQNIFEGCRVVLVKPSTLRTTVVASLAISTVCPIKVLGGFPALEFSLRVIVAFRIVMCLSSVRVW
jgi:hypothetical protein